MEDKRNQLIAWIKDAYGMEQAQLKMLDRFIKDFDDDEHIKNKLKEHREETKQQTKQIESWLERFEETPSKIKSSLGKLSGLFQGFSTSSAMDEKVKDMLLIHAGEHFEHASYMGLSEAAKNLGEDDIATAANKIAEEEKSTAEWAKEQIPRLIDRTLATV